MDNRSRIDFRAAALAGALLVAWVMAGCLAMLAKSGGGSGDHPPSPEDVGSAS